MEVVDALALHLTVVRAARAVEAAPTRTRNDAKGRQCRVG